MDRTCDYFGIGFLQLAGIMNASCTCAAEGVLPTSTSDSNGDSSSASSQSILIIVLVACVAVVTLVALLAARSTWRSQNQRKLQGLRRLRWRINMEYVSAPMLAAHEQYHLFLSHSWRSGQHQMRIIKMRLLQMIPDLIIFLDIDDLKFGYGAKGVARSKITLIYVTIEYFKSPNCMRELLIAILLNAFADDSDSPPDTERTPKSSASRAGWTKAAAGMQTVGMVAEQVKWPRDYSLCIFSPNGCTRRFTNRLISKAAFDQVLVRVEVFVTGEVLVRVEVFVRVKVLVRVEVLVRDEVFVRVGVC